MLVSAEVFLSVAHPGKHHLLEDALVKPIERVADSRVSITVQAMFALLKGELRERRKKVIAGTNSNQSLSSQSEIRMEKTVC